MDAIPSLTEKLSDCCSSVPLGHCGTINLPNGFAPIGDEDAPTTWPSLPPAGGGPVTNSGIRVQIIAAGFFIQPNPDREVLEPVVTIHNQGGNLMYVGLYSQSSTHETFITYFRVPPGGSVTVTWWTLWFRWLGAATPPLPGRENVQLAVTGEDAKGCYVVSWCCPVQAKVDVDVPVTVNIPEYFPPIIPAPEDPGDPGNVDVPVNPGRKKGRKR